jgi:hypothetical protein
MAVFTKENLEAIGIESLRTETRKTCGGGSWVVRAAKAELIDFILRGFGPDESEKAAIEARANARQETKVLPPAPAPVPGPDFKENLPEVYAPKAAPVPANLGGVASAIAASVQDAVTRALLSLQAPAATVSEEEIRNIAAPLVQSLVGEATELVKARVTATERVAADAQSSILDFDKRINSLEGSKRLEIKIGALPEVKLGPQHKSFEKLLRVITTKRRIPAYLCGPAGSGKTEAAHSAAKALNVPFHPISVCQQTSKADLLGYINPGTGLLVRTPFRNAFENGGVHLIDEIDAGNANVTVVLNAALSNGGCSFPDGYIQRHADFYCIAAANTWGYGADREYVGRNQLDGATRSRFGFIPWDYDEAFEKAISANPDWTARVQALRHAAFELKERIIISPRASLNGAELIASGFTPREVEDILIFGGVSADIAAKIRKAVAE